MFHRAPCKNLKTSVNRVGFDRINSIVQHMIAYSELSDSQIIVNLFVNNIIANKNLKEPDSTNTEI